jgi:uncharacterized membrane protein
MTSAMRVIIVTLVLGVMAVVTFLATVSGSIDAVAWALRTFGTLPVLLTAAFVGGCIVTHAIDRGLLERRESARDPGASNGP